MIHPYFNLSGSDARGLLYGLLEVDKIQLRDNPDMPSMRQLVQSGKVRYKRADPNEHWQSYKEIVDNVEEYGVAEADCEDIATAMAAEDQVRYGVLSIPYAYQPQEGLFHVVTAVPKDQYGAIPQHRWPSASQAPSLPGYVLQDPSAAAGMTSFGAVSGKEVSVSSFGAVGRSRYGQAPEPRRRRGLGRTLGAFTRSLLGDGQSAEDVARQIGSGAREESGIGRDWASELGRSIPGRLGLPGRASGDGEAAAISSLRKGAEAERRTGSGEEDLGGDGEEDVDFEDGLGEEEFGFGPEDHVGSSAWHADNLANRVADDMFGAVDDEVYRMGIFMDSFEGPLEDAHEEVGPRRYGGMPRGMPHLVRPGYMRPPSHMRRPDRPLVTFGDLVRDDADQYGQLLRTDLFGASAEDDDDDDAFDFEMSELEDLEIDLESEGF